MYGCGLLVGVIKAIFLSDIHVLQLYRVLKLSWQNADEAELNQQQ